MGGKYGLGILKTMKYIPVKCPGNPDDIQGGMTGRGGGEVTSFDRH